MLLAITFVDQADSDKQARHSWTSYAGNGERLEQLFLLLEPADCIAVVEGATLN